VHMGEDVGMASCMIVLLLCSRIYFYLTEMLPSTLCQCMTLSILKSVSHLDVLHGNRHIKVLLQLLQ
jgi:hypothetical protein